jgi:glycosyltransferase involved in cell wall biosynthesis
MPPMPTPEEVLAERFPRVAVVHDWWTKPGGSEQVVLQILELFGQAELFLSILDRDAALADRLAGRTVHTSYLDRVPGARRIYPFLLPAMNSAYEAFDLSGFDLVVSSNHACAKNVVTGPDTLHVCYCHTPMRYAWDPSFLSGERYGPLGDAVLGPVLARLRRNDLVGAFRPDHFLANSSVVAERIAKFYRREATVLHPPVEVDRFLRTPRAPGDYYLYFGRLVPYKRADLAVAACARLGRPIKVIGDGRGEARVRELAGPGAEFLGRVDDAELPALLAGARALLFPGEEDFGMVPIEAQAAGVPVIAYERGGARDTVTDGETGLLFGEQTVASLCAAIEAFESRPWDERALRANAERFRPERFRSELARFIANAHLAGRR